MQFSHHGYASSLPLAYNSLLHLGHPKERGKVVLCQPNFSPATA